MSKFVHCYRCGKRVRVLLPKLISKTSKWLCLDCADPTDLVKARDLVNEHLWPKHRVVRTKEKTDGRD